MKRVYHIVKQRRILPSETGFTIVEIMIVLAIAGLILLIVFLAIPALQRSSRNNQRKQDVQTILEALSHWELQNSGNVPAYVGNAWASGACKPDNPPAGGDNFLPNYVTQLTYYTSEEVQSTISPVGMGDNLGKPPETDVNCVNIFNHEKCNTNGDGSASFRGASYSDVVALYAIETSNGSYDSVCQQI